MTGILIPRKQVWTRQPQQHVGIDWSNPLTRNLAFAAFGIHPNSVVNNGYPTVSGGFTFSIGSQGICAKAPGTQIAGAVTYPSTINIAVSQNYSFLALVKPSTDSAGTGTAGTQYAIGSQPNKLSIGSTSIVATIDNNNVTLAHSLTSPTLFMAKRVGNQAYVYTPAGSNVATTGTRAQAITALLTGRDAGGSNLSNTETYLTLFYTRDISAYEYEELQRNPWQIFAPQTRSIFIPAASGGAYTLTAAQGTFTETGNNAGLTAQRNISASQGSFAESGQSTGLNAQRKIAASQGSFAESGQAADLTKTGSYSLTASQGSFAESGQVAGLTAQRKIGAEPGSISLIGQAATLTKTTAGQYVLTAAGGAFAETGSAAGLAAQRNLAVSYASFALSGQTAGLLKGRSLQAAYGSFSETGQSTNLTAQRLLASSAGSIVLAGGVVTFRHIIPGEVAPIAAEFAIRPPEYRWATRPTESRWAIHQN